MVKNLQANRFQEQKGFKLLTLLLVFTFSVSFSAYSQKFRTIGSGTWNGGTAVWEKETSDGSGVYAPTSDVPINSNSTEILIRSGHTVNLTTNITVDQTVVVSGGVLTIDPGSTLTIGSGNGDDITVGGTLNNNGTFAISTALGSRTAIVTGTFNNNGTVTGATTARLFFKPNSTYDHRFTTTAGVIPTATWESTSTMKISGYTTNESLPTGIGQVFSNFTWDTPALTNANGFFDLAGAVTSVGRNLTITNTNSLPLYFGGLVQMPSLQVGSNFIVNGGNVVLHNIGSTTVTIDGSLSVTAGSLDFADAPVATTINLKGDFSYTGGVASNSGGGDGLINFNGTATQSFTSLNLGGEKINFSVASNSSLNLGTSALTGTGNFNLNPNALLLVGSTEPGGAIQNSTAAGNIRVSGTKTFAGGSKIVFNGNAAQKTGAAFPSDVNLEVLNSAGVTLNSNLTINENRNLALTSGNLLVDAFTLTLNGVISGTENIITSSTSNMVINGSGNFGPIDFNNSSINNLTINRTSGNVTLGSDLTILGTLRITGGLLNTDISTVTLSNSASLVESSTNYVLGKIRTTSNLTASGSSNFKGIGATITSTGTTAPGNTTVTRQNDGVVMGSPNSSIQRQFFITADNNNAAGLEATLLFNYYDHELGANDEATLKMFKQTSGTSTWVKQEETDGKLYSRNTTDNTLSLSKVKGFSIWTMASDPVTLPVELVYFTAKRKANNTELAWKTAMEENNAGFEVQVSTDGKTFRKIAFVETLNGNTQLPQTYAFTDEETGKNGTRYYRLKQLDIDGTESYFAIKVVTFDGAETVVTAKAYPNPFTDSFTVEVDAAGATEIGLTITDLAGRDVYNKVISANNGINSVPVQLSSNLPAGIYILNVKTDSNVQRFKLLKK